MRPDGRERDLHVEIDSMRESAKEHVTADELQLQRMRAHAHDLGNRLAHRKLGWAARLVVEQRSFHPWADHDASGGKASLRI